MSNWSGKRSPVNSFFKTFANLLAFLAGNHVFMLRSAIGFFNNNVLHSVNQTASKVTCFRSFKSSIGFSFSPTMRCDEVFQNRKSFFKIGFNRKLNSFTARISNKPLHTTKLCNLPPVTTSTGIDHVINMIFRLLFEFLNHSVGDFVL